MEIKSFFYTFTNILSNPLMKRPFFKVSNFHVLTEDMTQVGRGWVGKCLENAGGCCPLSSVHSVTNIYSLHGGLAAYFV